MRIGLRDNHGLSTGIAETLLFYQNGDPSLTDVQFEALALGVGRGDSALARISAFHRTIWEVGMHFVVLLVGLSLTACGSSGLERPPSGRNVVECGGGDAYVAEFIPGSSTSIEVDNLQVTYKA